MKSSTPENSIFPKNQSPCLKGFKGSGKQKKIGKHCLTTLKIEGMLSLSHTFPALCIPCLVRRSFSSLPNLAT